MEAKCGRRFSSDISMQISSSSLGKEKSLNGRGFMTVGFHLNYIKHKTTAVKSTTGSYSIVKAQRYFSLLIVKHTNVFLHRQSTIECLATFSLG